MTGRIFLKLIAAVLCVLAVALAAVDYFAARVAERTYIATLTSDLAARLRLLAVLSPPPQAGSFQNAARALGGRLTLVAVDGTVLLDSEADAAKMENHGDRPEIIRALAGTVGSSTRPSSTLSGTTFLYVAIPVSQGVLRAAVPVAEVRTAVNAIRRQMLAAVAIAFLPAAVLAALFARYASRRLASIIDYAGKLAEGRFAARLKDPGGDELGILERKLNETGEKLERTMEQLQREHLELEKLERVRKDFVINVSHELRTPLASIQGYTETLLEGALHDPQNNVKFLSIIRRNAERLGRITADLLTLSRIELGQQRFQLTPHPVRELMAGSMDSVRPLAEKKQITLAMEPDGQQTAVCCDYEAVQQILANLLDNAIKYTPERGTITVGARPDVVSDGFVEIFVSDTGIGIPEEELPRLFERFYRVDKARSRELGGTGLGLAIVKHLVKAQGGDVRVASQRLQGSTFSFTLPADDSGPRQEAVQGELTAS
ncbi:MAG: HAMP domain-containing protein [Acidobacteria bacterium]|nr:HAMP domain-containing protein [Acidobacteriota bacterium]